MAKRTVDIAPKEQPEQVIRRIEDMLGVSSGQGRNTGQKDILSRLVELEERVEERSVKIEDLYFLIDDLGGKIADNSERQTHLDKRLINESTEFSDLLGKIELLEAKIDRVATVVDQDNKDFNKVEEEVENIKNIRVEANKEVTRYQQWVINEVEVMRGMIEELAFEIEASK